MPGIDLYLGPADGELLRRWITDDAEVAYVSAAADGEVSLAPAAPPLATGVHLLFHRSFEVVPRVAEPSADVAAAGDHLYAAMGRVAPPPPSGADTSHPAIIRMSIDYGDPDEGKPIGLSHVGWIGNRYASVGRPATAESERWWRRFRARVTRTARKVSRSGPLHELPHRFHAWAFPAAWAAIRAGADRAANPAS